MCELTLAYYDYRLLHNCFRKIRKISKVSKALTSVIGSSDHKNCLLRQLKLNNATKALTKALEGNKELAVKLVDVLSNPYLSCRCKCRSYRFLKDRDDTYLIKGSQFGYNGYNYELRYCMGCRTILIS